MRRPRFIAEQARDARGPLGRLVAWIMARETWRENVAAIDALEIAPGDRVLDLGCGHGRSLAALAERATRGHVSGADPSELMCEIAEARNRGLVRAGRVAVVRSSVDQLPYGDATFDAVLCVHVVYFWSDLDAALREVARVMRPGGRFAIVARTAANPAVASFPSEIYRFPALAELLASATRAGFAPELHGDRDETREPVLLLARKRGEGGRVRSAEGRS
ncbi:MAG: class I SAM-dependent methyltransferase [Myxococcota bacterium]|jgi:ubiquinone/menaquinone biosynthesis C-methylase UbiE